MLPFTHDQFLDVFARYNVAAWPTQVLAYLLAAAMIAALVRPAPASGRLIGGGLAAMWLWTGIGYHWMFFADINKAAWLFGVTLPLSDGVHSHSSTRFSWPGPRASFLQTSSG